MHSKMITYQIQKFENQIILVEQRDDEIPPVILDLNEEDQKIVENLVGEIIDEEDFKIKEIEINNYPGNFHTIAELVISDEIRSKLI